MGLKEKLLGESKKTKISVAIQPNKLHWVAGEHITGNVVFNKDAPVKIKEVRMRLLGYEWLQITEAYDVPAHKRTKTRIVLDSGPIIVFGQKRKEEAGQTLYPFSIKILDTATPSLRSPNQASVYYELKSELCFSNAPNVLSQVEVFVHKPLPALPPSAFVDKKTFFLKDPLTLRITRDKSAYVGGENVELDVSIDNKSPKDIARLIVSLDRKIKFGNNKETKALTCKEVAAPKFPVASGSRYQEIVNFELPKDLCPSAKGKDIEVSYTMTFILEFTSGGEWTSSMPFSIDSAIIEPEIEPPVPQAAVHELVSFPKGEVPPAAETLASPPVVIEHEDEVVQEARSEASSSSAAAVPAAAAAAAAAVAPAASQSAPQVMIVAGNPPPGVQPGQPTLVYTAQGQPIYIQYVPQQVPISHVGSQVPQSHVQAAPQPVGYGHPSMYSSLQSAPVYYTPELTNSQEAPIYPALHESSTCLASIPSGSQMPAFNPES